MIEEQRNRAIGALVGLAIGDAVGATLKFTERDNYEPITDMVGGGPFYLEAGQWTTNTALALCLADTILKNRYLDQKDLMSRFDRWWAEGYNSCTGTATGISNNVANALLDYEDHADPIAGSTDSSSAMNGSLTRLAPVPIFWNKNIKSALSAARDQSVTTHGASAAVDACTFFSALLVDAIGGMQKNDLLSGRGFSGDPDVVEVAAGSWKGKSRSAIQLSYFAVPTLEAALWSVDSSDDFEQAILLAANLGGDADAVASVTGQLAGAIWGIEKIPSHWKEKLAWYDKIYGMAASLFESSFSTTE
jgi:ADP-ribosyl-[dinitrogen reductase] hydrolase